MTEKHTGELAMEERLTRELEGLLAVDPSPEFLARVKTCIGERPSLADTARRIDDRTGELLAQSTARRQKELFMNGGEPDHLLDSWRSLRAAIDAEGAQGRVSTAEMVCTPPPIGMGTGRSARISSAGDGHCTNRRYSSGHPV